MGEAPTKTEFAQVPEGSVRAKILEQLKLAGRPLRPAELLPDVARSLPYVTFRLAVLTLISDGKVEFTPDWRLSVKTNG